MAIDNRVFHRCNVCGRIKSSTEFHRYKNGGLLRYCIICERKKIKNKVPNTSTKTEKRCAYCGTMKRIDDFYKAKANADGRETICRECRNQKKKLAYANRK